MDTTTATAPRKPMSADRLQLLAAARAKAADVRRQRAEEKRELQELQRLEKEAARQSVQKRKQELQAQLAPASSEEDSPSPVPQRRQPEAFPSATAVARERLLKLREEMMYKALFG